MSVEVRWVMRRNIASVATDAPFKDIVAVLTRDGLRAVPVTDDVGHVLGIVSESDLLAHASDASEHRFAVGRRERWARGKRRARTARDLMSAPVHTVTADTSVHDAGQLAFRHDVRQLPVVDGSGRLIGMLGRADILRAFLRPDDAVEREIEERVVRAEFCLDPATVEVSVRDGVVRVSGQVERAAVRDRLVDEIRRVTGVVAVDDALTCKEGDARAVRVVH